MSEEKKTRKRLILNINEELHKTIKIRAAVRNISMSTWVIRALYEKLKKEEAYENQPE